MNEDVASRLADECVNDLTSCMREKGFDLHNDACEALADLIYDHIMKYAANADVVKEQFQQELNEYMRK
jgi:5,10-methenyltetrahydromethanopterin hydrogenase